MLINKETVVSVLIGIVFLVAVSITILFADIIKPNVKIKSLITQTFKVR